MFETFNLDVILRERNDVTPLVVMMCGVAGSIFNFLGMTAYPVGTLIRYMPY